MTTDARLVLPAAVGGVAVGILVGFPGALPAVTVGAWVVTALVMGLAFRVPRWRSMLATMATVGVVAALLLTSAAVHTSARSPALLRSAAHDGRFVTVTATLDAEAGGYFARRATSVTIRDVSVGATTLHGVAIPALLFGEVPRSETGTKVSVSGTVATTDAGDRAAFLIFARGSARVVGAAPWFLEWSSALRSGFRDAAATLPGDGGALLPGLAIGDTSAVGPDLRQAMISTSLSHLTAVSGANCAVVVGLIMLLAGRWGASRTLRIILALIVLGAFVILVTPDGSVLRASVMAAIVLFSLARGRPARGLPVLCLAVILLLTADPWLSRDFGFILSVLATTGLVTLVGPLSRKLARWLPAPLAIVIAVPLAAQLACQPVLILLNPAIPVYGVIANLLAEPAAPLATVLGLIACVGLPFVPLVGHIIASIAWLPSAWIAGIAQFFSAAPGAQAPWIPGPLGALAIALVTVVGLFAVLARRSRITRAVAAALLLGLVSYSGLILGAGFARAASIPSRWQIAACDIGQGDAVLVRSQGQVALIDTGPSPPLLAKCLDELGIDRIQLLILSHYDLDHVGGTSAVLGRVDRALVGPVADANDVELRDALQGSGATLTEVARGASGVLGELGWDVLWPPARLGTIEPGNPASVTVAFHGVGACAEGCLSSLFLGDLGEESQSRMLGVAHPSTVDVVKVAHHGSADQSERLYQAIQARVGIISVGAENRYGHPTDRLLGILERTRTLITRTDLEGMILVTPSPDGDFTVWTEHPPGRDVGTH